MMCLGDSDRLPGGPRLLATLCGTLPRAVQGAGTETLPAELLRGFGGEAEGDEGELFGWLVGWGK